MTKPDKDRVKDLLSNWRRWARDDPPNPAEVHYYTISPMFRDIIPTASNPEPYDSRSAEMVEDVLRVMNHAYPKDRELIILYWIHMHNIRTLAEVVGIPKSTLYDHLMFAHGVFADMWAVLFYGGGK